MTTLRHSDVTIVVTNWLELNRLILAQTEYPKFKLYISGV